MASQTQNAIEIDDFIKASRTTCTGFVTREGSIKVGRKVVKGYWITTARGYEDFIDAASAELIAKSEGWWERFAAEMAA